MSPIKHTGKVVGHGGSGFTPATTRKFGEEIVTESAGDIGKRVSVEEEERRAAMARAQVIENLAESRLYEPPFPPFLADWSKAF